MSLSSLSATELRNRARLALCLLVPFVLLMVLVSPRGDFPLNDDWVYAKMVLRLVNEGHFGLSPFSNAFALTQVLYAAPLVKIFGFSFTLLRLTTIFMAWVTVCMVAFTALELGLSNRAALLAGGTLLANPIFINLSYTFMTDVPFMAFASVSAYFFVTALRSGAARHALLASLFSLIAFYDRQLGALLPAACLLSALFYIQPGSRKSERRVTVATLIPWLAGLMAIPFVQVSKDERIYTLQTAEPGRVGLLLAGFGAVSVAIYIGLFLLPAACAMTCSGKHRAANLDSRIVVLMFACITLVGVLPIAFFPSLPNILRDFGVGPALFDFVGERWDAKPGFTPIRLGGMWAVVAVIATGAFCALSNALWRKMKLLRHRSAHVRLSQFFFLFLYGLSCVTLPALSNIGPYFDRYILVALPPLAVLTAACPGQSNRYGKTIVPVFALSALAMWSILGLQDYMAWNTARWKAVELLRTKFGAHDNEINAGFEFNGMYTSDEYLRRLREKPDQHLGQWWVLGDKFIVSPIKLGDAKVQIPLEQVPYYSWLGFESRSIYVYERETARAQK